MAAPTLCMHPLPSLISSCLNLPFGTQGRSGRQESDHYKEQGTEKSFIQKPRVLLGFSAENLFIQFKIQYFLTSLLMI